MATLNVNKAEFIKSAASPRQFIQSSIPSVVFAGKSNVGKSSVINRMLNRKNFARVGASPGKTIHVNYFFIDQKIYFVDLPGYGYAKRSKKEIARLDQMIRSYILQRQQLVNVFVLIDIRLEPQKIDLEFIEWLGASSIPFSLVFTKADKLTAGKAKANLEGYKKTLEVTWEELPPIFVTSSEKRQGKEELLDYIDSINKALQENG